MFYVFTSSQEVYNEARNIGVGSIYVRELATVGLHIKVRNNEQLNFLRRHFLQAVYSFAVADHGTHMLWQSPGTVWLGDHTTITKSTPTGTEVAWAYKGRKDRRAAPFFTSYDFFLASSEDRSTHLLHEILLHFDLVVAWESLDAVTAYRLSENNSRYGTVSHLFPPNLILHIDQLGRKPERIREAATDSQKPTAIVIPTEGLSASAAKQLLVDSGLWLN
jgi:hypothetical protein